MGLFDRIFGRRKQEPTPAISHNEPVAEIKRLDEEIITPPPEFSDPKECLQWLLDRAGLSRYSDNILQLTMNGIKARGELVDETTLPLGVSKIGGKPDLPPSIVWPRWIEHGPPTENPHEGEPLSFIAQLNFTELRPHDLDRLLPESGILYVFYDYENYPCFKEDSAGWRVLYYDGDMSNLRRTEFPDDLSKSGQFGALVLSFSHNITIPYWGTAFLDRLGMSEDEQYEKYANVLIEFSKRYMQPTTESGVPWHQVLGHPAEMQSDVLHHQLSAIPGYGIDDDQLSIEESSEWLLLLQVDSTVNKSTDNGMVWGDLGMLFFCIRREDLEARDFSRVCWSIDSS